MQEESKAIRKQRRVNGAKQNYIVCSASGKEFNSMREYNAYIQSRRSERSLQRFNLVEQIAYSYMRSRSTEDKSYAVQLMQKDQNKAYHQVKVRRYWAEQAMDTQFHEETKYIAWDELRQDWYNTSKSDSKAIEIPVVYYLTEDYLERLLRHSALIVDNGASSLSRLDIKALLKASEAESYRWYNAVQDAWEVCSAEQLDCEVPF